MEHKLNAVNDISLYLFASNVKLNVTIQTAFKIKLKGH